jgi:hypothetical protein
VFQCWLPWGSTFLARGFRGAEEAVTTRNRCEFMLTIAPLPIPNVDWIANKIVPCSEKRRRFLFFAGVTQAQEGSSAVRGRVVDPQDAALPGVTVSMSFGSKDLPGELSIGEG